MCFPTPKAPTPPPIPTPTPTPMPADVNPVATEQQRALKIQNLKQGILSTIKTSPSGTTGAGSDVNTGQGKKTLGGS